MIGAIDTAASLSSLPWKRPIVENITMPSTTSAIRFRNVCATSVPSTTGSRSRTRPTRRATISAREGSPSRAGKVADIKTPIIVPRAASRLRTRALGSAARRTACHASARTSIDAHMSANATSTQTGVAARRALPIGLSPMWSSASAVRPTPSSAQPRTAARRTARNARLRPAPGSAGSSEGIRRAGARGPRSALRTPVRTAARCIAVEGSGIATACS